MNGERLILIAIILFSIFVIFKFVPLNKIRDAWVLFLSLQMMTWILGLLAVEKELIEYPIQLFPHENMNNKSSFSFEFYVFPVVGIIFSLYYPSKSNKIIQFLYYLIIISFFTFLEVLIERNTDLVHYIKWKWYWSLLSITIVLFINHTYYTWYKKELIEVRKL